MIEKERTGRVDSIIPSRRTVSEVLSTLTPTDEILQGGLNINRAYVDVDGNKFLHRIAKERVIVVDKMMRSYHEIGFTSNGGVLSYLNTEQQATKMWKMAELGLQTLVPIASDGDQMIVPFIEGEMLQSYLQSGKHAVVPDVMDHLMLAHQKGIIFGDRWTSNTIIKPDESFIELDFDVDLLGQNAKEFEMTQFMYHILLYSESRETMVGLMDDYWLKRKSALKGYNSEMITRFMLGHLHVYDGTIDPTNGARNNIGEEVIKVLDIIA